MLDIVILLSSFFSVLYSWNQVIWAQNVTDANEYVLILAFCVLSCGSLIHRSKNFADSVCATGRAVIVWCSREGGETGERQEKSIFSPKPLWGRETQHYSAALLCSASSIKKGCWAKDGDGRRPRSRWGGSVGVASNVHPFTGGHEVATMFASWPYFSFASSSS